MSLLLFQLLSGQQNLKQQAQIYWSSWALMLLISGPEKLIVSGSGHCQCYLAFDGLFFERSQASIRAF